MSDHADSEAVALITGAGGPVVFARTNMPMRLNEAVRVGPEFLLGEIVKLNGSELVVQVYEDTSGLRPGDWLLGTGGPLSAQLGPGLLGGVFDGLLRPLTPDKLFIRRGTRKPPSQKFYFEPLLQLGSEVEGGERLGRIIVEHRPDQFILIPPELAGKVESIVEGSIYADDECICRLRAADGRVHDIKMTHRWPVRVPRPIRQRLEP